MSTERIASEVLYVSMRTALERLSGNVMQQIEEHRDEMLVLNTLCPGGFPLIGNLLKSRSPVDSRIKRVSTHMLTV